MDLACYVHLPIVAERDLSVGVLIQDQIHWLNTSPIQVLEYNSNNNNTHTSRGIASTVKNS